MDLPDPTKNWQTSFMASLPWRMVIHENIFFGCDAPPNAWRRFWFELFFGIRWERRRINANEYRDYLDNMIMRIEAGKAN
jgi:hypothetical protein